MPPHQTPRASMRGIRRRLTVLTATVGLAASLATSATAADGASPARSNHCISPAGDDLNEVFATTDAFVAPFCTVVHTGDHWRPIIRIQVAGADPVFPPGYDPLRTSLDEDLLAKLVSARYVVDAGTRRARSFAVPSADLTLQTGQLPNGRRFVRWVGRIHPLPPGNHTVDEYVTLSDDFWDGLGTDPEANLIPAGEILLIPVGFTVAQPHRG